jgi:TIR domain
MKKIFISYSSKDYKWLEQLEEHLSSPTVRLWADVNIRPGEDWNPSVKDSIEASDFAIVLVSPDYLSSKMIDNELPIIFDRGKQGKLEVLPIVTSWKDQQFRDAVNKLFDEYPLVSDESLAKDDKENIYRTISEKLSGASNKNSEPYGIFNFNLSKVWRKITKSDEDDQLVESAKDRGRDLRKNIFFEIEEKLARQEQEKLAQRHD